MIRRFLTACFGALILGAVSLPALAADAVYNWSGLNVGINGGGVLGRTDWQFANLNQVNHSTMGGMVGGTINYNFQTGNWVYGLEADYDWADISGDKACTNPVYRCKSEIDTFGTLRARGGYAVDNIVPFIPHLLPYFTVGMAQSYFDVNTTLTTTGATAGTTKSLFGWTIGGGSEVAIMNRVSAKLEYLYYEYGSEHYTVDSNTDVQAKNRGNIFRAGVSYKLY